MKERLAGPHPVRAALIALGLAGISCLAPAQTIPNPSFEANSFTTNPGYISGNVAIVGWTAGNNGGAGLNPANGNPFANNGAVPDPTNVAFIQASATSSLSTVISNLTVGETYKVNFRLNARDFSGHTPNLKVSIDGVNLIYAVVTNVESTPNHVTPYNYFAFDFTAADTNQKMTLSNDASTDATVLVDNFSIAVRNSGWSYAAWNDDASSGVEVAPSNYTHAFNFGSGSNATINGVTFTGVAGANPSHGGSNAFSTTGLSAFTTDVSNNLTNGGSAVLAHDFVYNGNPATLTVSNLTVGKSYVTTIYSVGFDSSGARAATFSVGNDRLTVNQDQFGDNHGIRVSYFFTAASTTNTITYFPLQAFYTFHTYGFANYVSPPLQIVNPSFEADTFTNYPGYVSGNFPITGWNGFGRLGVNPTTSGGPFTDNGTIPDGTKAAFIQGDSNYNGALTQVIHGFTNGASYQVRYFENSRSGGTMPFVEVRMGGQPVVAAHAVSPVGGTNLYHRVFSDAFTATNTSLELAFIKSNPQGGDTTLLIDNVSINPLTSNQPPVAFTLAANLITTNSTARLNGQASAQGSPTTAWFQWGTDTNYGYVTAPQAIGSGGALSNLDAVVGPLLPGGYHYRLVASNLFGVSAGVDQSFTIPTFNSLSIPGLPTVGSGSVAWGDFDNDGRLDFLITGEFFDGNNFNPVSQLWRNMGSGFTNVPIPGLPGVQNSSVAWGDFDNDGRLDFLISGDYYDGTNYNPVSQLWRNTGNGFTNVPIPGLPQVDHSSVAWGDFDNDGRLDFLITGEYYDGTNYIEISQLWRNTGSGFTNVPIPGLLQVGSGSVAWGDFDNDGRLDFLITGSDTNRNPIFQLWRNTGSGFTNVPIPGLTQVSGSVAWGDFDNDGRLDFLFAGSDTNFNAVSQLWRNTGSGFTNVSIPGLTQVSGSVAWGDFDNDGRLDFLITGFDGANYISQLWCSTGSGFSNVTASVAPGLPGVSFSSVAWGDFDNDGSLDFLITGEYFVGQTFYDISQLWRNNLPGNAPPAAPAGLSAILSSNTVTLNWTAPADDHTPAAGLNYNLRIGSTPGGSDILAPQALASGTRLLPQIGNAGPGLSAFYQFAPVAAHYYWSVQAVDTSFASSPFAAEAGFTILPLLVQPIRLGNGAFQFSLTNTFGGTWAVRATTNLALPVTNWDNLGPPTSLGSNLYQFTDNAASNFARRYYLLQKQ